VKSLAQINEASGAKSPLPPFINYSIYKRLERERVGVRGKLCSSFRPFPHPNPLPQPPSVYLKASAKWERAF